MGFVKEITQFKWLINLIIFIGFLYFVIYPQTFGGECNFNRPDCDEDGYCGIDNQCHKFPYQDIIEKKQITERKQAIGIPILISVALIGGAYWYRKNDQK